MLTPLFKIGIPTGNRGRLPRIGRTHANPLDEITDDGVVEFLFRRHRQFGIGVANGFDEQTCRRIAGHDAGARIAPFAHGVGMVERQIRLDLPLLAIGKGRRRMARVTLGDQDRADLLFEERDASGIGIRGLFRLLGHKWGRQEKGNRT